MSRISLSFVAAVVALACVAGRGSAQPPGIQPPFPGGPTLARPAVSPYLNLTSRVIDPAVTYYGIVRPQFVTNNAIQSLQQQVTLPLAAAQTAGDAGLPVTGQPTYFLNTGGYFLNARTGSAPPLTGNMTRPAAPLTPPAAPATPRPTPAH
jgi:hypothetical protein